MKIGRITKVRKTGSQPLKIVAFSNAAICLVIGVFTVYSIVRFRTGGSHLTFWILFQRFLPSVIFLVPLFVLFRALGISGTHLSLILAYMLR